jgi:hypothetical protein
VKNQLFYLNKIFETNANSKNVKTQFEDMIDDDEELFKAYENLNMNQIRRLSKIDINQLRSYAKSQIGANNSLYNHQKNTVNFLETPLYDSPIHQKAQST